MARSEVKRQSRGFSDWRGGWVMTFHTAGLVVLIFFPERVGILNNTGIGQDMTIPAKHLGLRYVR